MWLKVIIAVLTFLFFAAFVYAAIQFFNSAELKEMVKWLAIGGLFFGMTMSLKLWQWMQMEKNAVLREMRRIELQLSIIAKANNNK